MNVGEIKTVAVLGAGTMGNGIAHVFARAGYGVILRDVEQRFLDRALETISKNLDREVKKEKMTRRGKASTLGRISADDRHGGAGRGGFRRRGGARANGVEDARAEGSGRGAAARRDSGDQHVFDFDHALAAQTSRAESFIGMHFMNPVPVMALVEVIRGLQTSDDTFATTMELCEKLGKKPVAVNDAPGFVSNRVLMPMINEAAFCVMEGVATPEAVDAVMKMGMDHPMGPLELADFIGLDVCVDILDVLRRVRRSEISRVPAAAATCGRRLAWAANPAADSTSIDLLGSESAEPPSGLLRILYR